jgi:hypothetical protein
MAMCWNPKDGIAAIGSGGNYALSAAKALVDYEDRPRKDRPQGDGRSRPMSASSPMTG